jgi:hypothetical protein
VDKKREKTTVAEKLKRHGVDQMSGKQMRRQKSCHETKTIKKKERKQQQLDGGSFGECRCLYWSASWGITDSFGSHH